MSDLHVGEGLFRPELLSAAVEEANELAPDLVVVAGDLTMEGYRGEFEQCRRFLDELACAHVVVTMGNHDARNVGYRHFEDFFGSRDSVTTVELADGRARVVAIDSTKPDVDEGEVGREHYGWLDASLRDWTEGPRIVVIHHHILAVPGTGRDVNNLRDAGDVMAILRELEVDLVLSGHRHVPYVWSISGVRVVHSGTVSTLRVRGTMPPSYNVIEIDADEVRIVMRQPGQGAQGEEPLAHFARRPVTTSEFHPPLERFVRYARGAGAAVRRREHRLRSRRAPGPGRGRADDHRPARGRPAGGPAPRGRGRRRPPAEDDRRRGRRREHMPLLPRRVGSGRPLRGLHLPVPRLIRGPCRRRAPDTLVTWTTRRSDLSSPGLPERIPRAAPSSSGRRSSPRGRLACGRHLDRRPRRIPRSRRADVTPAWPPRGAPCMPTAGPSRGTPHATSCPSAPSTDPRGISAPQAG